jgi:putative DNA primase/helicase
MVWPDAPRDWRDIDRPSDKEAAAAAIGLFEKVAALDPENPLELRFSESAQQLFNEWYETNETKVRGGELHPAMESHLAKYRSLVPSFAGLFHLSAWAHGETTEMQISLSATQQAAAWAAYPRGASLFLRDDTPKAGGGAAGGKD